MVDILIFLVLLACVALVFIGLPLAAGSMAGAATAAISRPSHARPRIESTPHSIKRRGQVRDRVMLVLAAASIVGAALQLLGVI